MIGQSVLRRFGVLVVACSVAAGVAVVVSLPGPSPVEGDSLVEGRRGDVPTVDELIEAAASGPAPLGAPDASLVSHTKSGGETERRLEVGEADRVVVPAEGGSVSAGRAELTFAGVGDGVQVDVAPLPVVADATLRRAESAGLPAAGVELVGRFEVTATDADGGVVRALEPSFEIVPADPETGTPAYETNVVPGLAFEIDIDAGAIEGLDPGSVGLWTREGPSDAWVRLPSFYDPVQGIVVAETNHLSEFAVIGEPAVQAGTGPKVALDPDSKLGSAVWGGVTYWETDFSVPLAEAVRDRLVADCAADVLITRDASSPDVISHAVRVGQINSHGSVVAVTVAHNALFGTPWGDATNGGLATWAKTGDAGSALLAGQLVTEWDVRTSLNNTTMSTVGLPFAPDARYTTFEGVTGSHSHVELGFLDHNADWPVIRDESLTTLVDVVFTGIAVELENQGFACDGVAPSGLPARPDPAALLRYYQLGLRNHLIYTGDPVSVPTGNLMEQFDVLSLTGPGDVAIDVGLTYNSQDDRQGRFGVGWWSNIDSRAQRFDDGSVMIVRGDGASFMFEPDGAGGYIGGQGTFATLTEAGSGVLQMDMADGSSYTYDASGEEGVGWLTSMTTVTGQTLTYSYGAPSATAKVLPLESITDPAGQSVTFGSDTDGRVTTATLPDGRTWTFAYTATGELESFTDPTGLERSFTYDDQHQMLTLTDPDAVIYLTNIFDADGRIVGQTDGLGNTRSWTYGTNQVTYTNAEDVDTVYTFDTFGNITSVSDPAGTAIYNFDANGLLLSEVDRAGRTTTYTYTANGLLASETNPAGNTVSYTYNADGLVTSITDQGGIGGANRTETNTYDTAGRLTLTTRPDTTTVQHTYNTLGDLIELIDPLGAVSTFGYDDRGNMVTVNDALGGIWTYGYDASNRMTIATAPNGAVVAYDYDDSDRLVSVTAPDGGITTHAYDGWDRVVATVDPLGNVTTSSFDAAGRLTGLIAADGGVTEFGYNAEDVQTELVDPLGRTTTTTLDASLRPVTVSDPTGAATSFTLDPTDLILTATDPVGSTTVFTYDSAGRAATVTDATGVTRANTYDAAGRIVRSERNDGTGIDTLFDVMGRPAVVTNPDGTTEGFRYDAGGNTIEYIDQAGHMWTFSFDTASQLIAATDPLGATTTYVYDNMGRQTTITDPTGATTSYTYDLADNLVTITDPAGTETTYEHDLSGRVVEMTDPAGSTSTTGFDPVGRVAAETNALGDTTNATYDLAGQMTGFVDRRGTTTGYDYDLAGRLITQTRNQQTGVTPDDTVNVATSYSYDPAGRTTAVIDPNGGTTSYSHDPVGRVTETIDPLGRITTAVYDAVGRTATTTLPDGVQIGFEYDAMDRVTHQVWSSGYDRYLLYTPRGELHSLGDNTGVIDWVHDPVGGLIKETTGTGEVSYSYDLAGRQLTRTLDDGTIIASAYDPAGRITQTNAADVTIGYGYDTAGRVDTVTRSNNTVTNYTFDALSRPVSQTLTVPTTAAPDAGFEYIPAERKKNEPRSIIDWSYSRLAHTEDAVTDGVWSETIAFDPNGNISASTKTISGAIPDGMITPGMITNPAVIADTYSYDSLNRLIGSTSDQVVSSFEYDANSNRTAMFTTDDAATPTVVDPVDIVATFDAGNQISQMVAVNPDGTTTTDHNYNLRGARTAETVTSAPGGAVFEMVWSYDELMRVTGIDRPDRTTSIVRDPDGRAASVSASTPFGDTITDIGYTGREPATIDQPEHDAATVIHDAMGAPAVEVDNDGTQRWLVTSLLGDITGTANGTGAITELADAADYGTTTFLTDQWSSIHQATGELSLLNADGMQLFHQRVYQPGNGSWNQADSIQALNRHSYVGGNPTTFTDYHGYIAIDRGERPGRSKVPPGSCPYFPVPGGPCGPPLPPNKRFQGEDASASIQAPRPESPSANADDQVSLQHCLDCLSPSGDWSLPVNREDTVCHGDDPSQGTDLTRPHHDHPASDIYGACSANGIAGRPAFAMATGTIVSLQLVDEGSCGVQITTRVDGFLITYCHGTVGSVNPDLTSGDTIKAGTYVFDVGSTGSGSGGTPHLHIQIKPEGDGSTSYCPQDLLIPIYNGQEPPPIASIESGAWDWNDDFPCWHPKDATVVR